MVVRLGECRSRVIVTLCSLVALLVVISATAAGARQAPQSSARSAAWRTCTDLVVNGDFEQGISNPTPWVLEGHAEVSDERPHSGYLGIWMGGYQDADDALYQLVSIPTDWQAAVLHYWWSMHSLDDAEKPYDYLYVTLQTADGEPLAELETLDNTGVRNVWTYSTFDLSAYIGMSLRLHFRCTGNEAFITSFFLDDVQLLELCEHRYLPLVWHDSSAAKRSELQQD